jgi:hypothetical protein
MKRLASLLLLTGGATLVACQNPTESAYEVADTDQVTLALTGMT